MKMRKGLLLLVVALGVSVMGRAMAVDKDGCLQPGDEYYDPSLPFQTPVGPPGPQWTPEQLADHDRVAAAINDRNYGGQLMQQWDDALRAGRTDLRDDSDMRVSIVAPQLQQDGTVIVLVGVNTNGRPIPDGALPQTFLGHPVKVFSQPFFTSATKIIPRKEVAVEVPFGPRLRS
jgi:hypothetical protein